MQETILDLINNYHGTSKDRDSSISIDPCFDRSITLPRTERFVLLLITILIVTFNIRINNNVN